ncbi:MAG: HEAT repeat domain-containing protein [Polyangia bacterium]
MRSFRTAPLIVMLALALSPLSARADRWSALDKATRDSSWRVRLQAASVLAKDHDPRALALLERMLHDGQPTVRRAAEVALDHLRTPVAVVVPKATKKNDVRIMIGGVGAKSKNATPMMTRQLRTLLEREFAHTPAIVVNGEPVSGYLIDGSIVVLDHKATREWMEITCEVKVIVGRLPEKAMVMMTSGGATVQEPRGDYSPARAAALDADALEGAVKGAHDNVLVFLRTH